MPDLLQATPEMAIEYAPNLRRSSPESCCAIHRMASEWATSVS